MTSRWTLALGAAMLLACDARPAPDGDSPAAWSDRFVAVGTGDTMHVVFRNIDRPRVLVFVPGMADTWASYRALVAALPDSFGLVLVDALGHGHSTKRPASIGPARQAEAIGITLDSLGVTPFAVIGHSYGGVITQHFGAQRPELPAAVLMATLATTRGLESEAAWIEFAAAIPDTVPDEILEIQRESFHAAVPDSVVRPYIDAARMSPGHVWREVVRSVLDGDTRGMLADWKPRTLLVMASADRVLEPATMTVLAGALPDADTVRIGRTSHAMHWERPDTVARVIVDFLAGVPQARKAMSSASRQLSSMRPEERVWKVY